MRSVLLGNGLIIQYGGAAYTNRSIIRRAQANVKSGRFPNHLYPPECAQALVAFHSEYPAVVRGEYDRYTVATFEKEALADFKRRYSGRSRLTVEDVGIEDYFLLFELIHNRHDVGNPERFHSRACLKRLLLDAIFNGGAIQDIHRSFPRGLVDFLLQQDRILTTNYDRNIEASTGAEVLHLHGAFHVLAAQYDPRSIRHQLSEDLLDGETVDPDHEHLFSSCLVSYVSELKIYEMSQSHAANRALSKFAEGYANDPSLQEEIDAWPDTDPLLRRLREGIRVKAKRPELEHVAPYSERGFESLAGTLAVVGLSPRNDGHIFRAIDENTSLSSVEYYFFDPGEAAEARALLPHQDVGAVDVREFWSRLSSSR